MDFIKNTTSKMSNLGKVNFFSPFHTIFGKATGSTSVLINIGCDLGVPSIVSNM